jgi:putative methyltransferase (TIGR04325 family)
MKEALERTPVLRSLGEHLYERRFSGDLFGSFRGVFANFSQARQSAPSTKSVGFNSAACAQQFQERRHHVYSFDYPVLFWLRCLLRENPAIFDLGGHVGIQFYSYSRYLQYPADLRWKVCDLPEITKEGQTLAAAEGHTALSFTNHLEDADGADILLAAGSLQYVESPGFAELLSSLKRKPRHLLVNKVPLYDGDPFVTLQNGGSAFHPMYVFNRGEFIDSLASLGYRVIDTWDVVTHPGHIPFHPDRSFACHSGLYLTKDSSPSQN